jgi:hypothetical protein
MSNVVELHPAQSEVYSALFIEKLMRFCVVVSSRGWGKSFFAASAATTAVHELLALNPRVPHKIVYIIAPTYTQVTDIYYPILMYQFGLEHLVIKESRADGRLWFPNNVELRLLSYEAIERMRGMGAYFVVLDEVESWTKGIGFKAAWEGIIQPCITTRWSEARAEAYRSPNAGRALTIGTPKGYTYFYDQYNLKESDPNWGSFHFDYTQSPYLDPVEIERLRHTIDPLEFAREYLASFEESGNSVFYCFDRKIHVRNDLPEFTNNAKFKEDVHIGIDFNVGIQASSVFAIRGGQVHYLDEFKGHPDTDTLARVIKAKYIDKGHKVHAYPDPTGRSRKTSAAVGVTDFSILAQYGIQCHAPAGSPPLVDSAKCVNRMLKTAAGDVNMFVHPRCTGIIQSLERTIWTDTNPNVATIDKSEGIEHYSDGVRYSMSYCFPINVGTKRVITGVRF